MHPIESPRRTAFTLTELILTITLLTLLTLAVSKLVSGASDLILLSGQRVDADRQARAVLDRMAVDVSAIVKRPDVDYYFEKNAGNDQFAFYSEATGYYPADATGSTPKSPVSIVGYRLSNNRLERLSKALIWNGVTGTGTPMVFLPQTITGTWTDVAGAGPDVDYQTIGDQVYRFEFCFLMKDGSISEQPWLSPNVTYTGLQDVSGLIVAIAILDNKSRLVAGDLANAVAKLEDVSGTSITTLPAELWQEKIRLGDLGLPKKAAAKVRVYQRYYAITSGN